MNYKEEIKNHYNKIEELKKLEKEETAKMVGEIKGKCFKLDSLSYIKVKFVHGVNNNKSIDVSGVRIYVSNNSTAIECDAMDSIFLDQEVNKEAFLQAYSNALIMIEKEL